MPVCVCDCYLKQQRTSFSTRDRQQTSLNPHYCGGHTKLCVGRSYDAEVGATLNNLLMNKEASYLTLHQLGDSACSDCYSICRNMLCEKLVFDLKKQFRLPQLSRCKVSSICRFSFCSLLVTDFGKCTDPWKFLLYALRDVLKWLSSKTAWTGGEEEKPKTRGMLKSGRHMQSYF